MNEVSRQHDKRSDSARFHAAIAYIRIVSVLTLVTSVMVCGLIHGVLDWAGLNTDFAGYLMFVAVPVFGCSLTRFAIRDFHRRA